MHDIGTKIRTARIEKRLSRRAFGDLVGISESKVQAIEIGKQRVDHDTLYNIAKSAQLDISWLLSLDDEQTAVTGVVPTIDKDEHSLSDLVRLRLAIEAIEESLDALDRVATPEVKAGLIVAAYELLEQEGAKATAQIIRLVKAA